MRPEALAGRLHRATEIESEFPHMGAMFSDFTTSINSTINEVKTLNASSGQASALLPMAFQEGSPMHPSYGAGHGAVAGGCVTILKAFFDMDCMFVRRGGKDMFNRLEPGDTSIEYTSNANGSSLVDTTGNAFLTLESELNKLAANISISRNHRL